MKTLWYLCGEEKYADSESVSYFIEKWVVKNFGKFYTRKRSATQICVVQSKKNESAKSCKIAYDLQQSSDEEFFL